MSEELADLVWKLVREWDGFAKDTVGKQMVRAGDSVGANIAEGYGRASRVDNQRFVRIARGSLYELRHFLRRAEKRGLIGKEGKKPVALLMRELLPALNAYLASLGEHGG